MQRLIMLLGVAAALTAGPASAAPTITEYDPLSFGEMTIVGTSAQSLVIAPDGTESHDPGIVPLLSGHNGLLRLTDFPVNTTVAVMADDSTLNRQPSGAVFDITAFTFDPDAASQVTDGDGKMILKIGATLSTRANITYVAGPYRGTYNLLVNY